MKIREAIENIKTTRPSQYTDQQMMAWLSELDGQVWEELMAKYGAPAPFLPYRRTQLEMEMLIPFPHDQIYINYLMAKIDFSNAEFERYNNEMMLYNAQLQAFYDAWTRTHRTKPVRIQGVKAL